MELFEQLGKICDPRYKSDRMSPGYEGEESILPETFICPVCKDKHGENKDLKEVEKIEKPCNECSYKNLADKILNIGIDIEMIENKITMIKHNHGVLKEVFQLELNDMIFEVNNQLKELYDKREYFNNNLIND